jgi:hypothetical protein
MRTSKTQHLKSFRMNTYRKTGEGVPSFIFSARLCDLCISALSFLRIARRAIDTRPQQESRPGCSRRAAHDSLLPISYSLYVRCRSEGRSIQQRLQALQDLRKLRRQRRHCQHTDRRSTPRIDPPVNQFPAVFRRVPNVHRHAFVRAAHARRHRRLDLGIAQVAAQRADLRLDKLLQRNSAEQFFGGRNAAGKFFMARLLQPKSFLHLPLRRRRRKRPAHHGEGRAWWSAAVAALKRPISKLPRNVRSNAWRRLTRPPLIRATARRAWNSARTGRSLHRRLWRRPLSYRRVASRLKFLRRCFNACIPRPTRIDNRVQTVTRHSSRPKFRNDLDLRLFNARSLCGPQRRSLR